MAVEPLEMFAQVTTALTELGLTDQQLSSIRYTGKHSHLPIDEWPITWDPEIPFESITQIPSLMRQFVILRFALFDGPAGHSSHVAQAFRFISDDKVGRLAADQLAYCARQKEAAQKERGRIEGLGMTMREVVVEYACLDQNRLLTAKELWIGFGQHFSLKAGLDMELKGDRYIYLDDKSLAYVTFRNYVGEGRKSISH